MTGNPLPRSTVRLVNDRADGRCERCRTWIHPMVGHSLHHRCPRAMGGTRDPLSYHPSNIVLLCGSGTTGCHGRLERHRLYAAAQGWIIPQMTSGERSDPREHPIYLPRFASWMYPGPGRWFALPERIEGHDRAAILR